jgi:hypothetical protein
MQAILIYFIALLTFCKLKKGPLLDFEYRTENFLRHDTLRTILYCVHNKDNKYTRTLCEIIRVIMSRNFFHKIIYFLNI